MDTTAMTGDNDKVLQIKGLRTNFYTEQGVIRAVNELSYDVKKGECVALVGESACGKSVSALSIMRLVPNPPGRIVGGEIWFRGENILKATPHRTREIRGNMISMVFQEPTTSLNPLLSVGAQISETLQLHKKMTRQEALNESVDLLKQVGIPDAEQRINAFPHEFSGGMQQRIMIAMGISCKPDVLIADEPTTSLDVTVQAQILELLERLRSDFGTAVVLITHNLGVVARYVQRVNVMYAGTLVESGPTERIYEEPKHPYTIGLLKSVPRLDSPGKQAPRIIRGQPPNLATLGRGCPFAPRCDYVMDICTQTKPPLETVDEEHVRACFFDASKLSL